MKKNMDSSVFDAGAKDTGQPSVAIAAEPTPPPRVCPIRQRWCYDERCAQGCRRDQAAEFPACMAPDGAEPCSAYLREFGQRMDADRRLRRIEAIIEHVDNRCMATDGPVRPTLSEMTQAEISEIYRLAKAVPQTVE